MLLLLFIYFCYLQEFCGKASVCGHYCRGIKDEETCLPCLSCSYDNAKQTANDICAICYTDALPAKPSIQVRFPVFVCLLHYRLLVLICRNIFLFNENFCLFCWSYWIELNTFWVVFQELYILVYIYIYILRQSINGDDYLSGAAQREQTNNF